MIKFRLDRFMEDNNLTIQDVHEKTDISRNTISLMINKEPKGIQFDTLDKLVSNLEVPVEVLIEYIPDEGKDITIIDKTDGGYFTEIEFSDHKEDAEKNISKVSRQYVLSLTINVPHIVGTKVTLEDLPILAEANILSQNESGDSVSTLDVSFEFKENNNYLEFIKESNEEFYNLICKKIQIFIGKSVINYLKEFHDYLEDNTVYLDKTTYK